MEAGLVHGRQGSAGRSAPGCARMSGVFRSFLERIGLAGDGPTRVSGPPTSSNEASSFHLYWDVPPEPLAEVRATIEVVEPPTVDRLYFWALQASFQQAGTRRGGAHFGLQHHPSYPGAGAVNWGGYHAAGGELEGSGSTLPSALDNVNTRTYPWAAGRPYRYRIFRSPDRGWRGSLTDLETCIETVVRDLWVEGDHLTSPMVWTEAFADCGEPPATVRWRDLEAVTTSGVTHHVSSVRVNYQSYADGGCTNTNVSTVEKRLGAAHRYPARDPDREHAPDLSGRNPAIPRNLSSLRRMPLQTRQISRGLRRAGRDRGSVRLGEPTLGWNLAPRRRRKRQPGRRITSCRPCRPCRPCRAWPGPRLPLRACRRRGIRW